MGLLAEFDLVSDFGFTDYTTEYAIQPDYSEGNAIFVETFLRVSRNLVPVDTGYLKSSLSAEENDTYLSAEASAEYAQYVEYGTWCQSPQPYFAPALQEALMAAVPSWSAAEQDAWDEEQELLMAEMMEAAESDVAISGGGGGLNFSSPTAFIGSVIGLFLVAVAVVIVQEFFKAIDPTDTPFNSYSSGGYLGGGGESGSVFMPEIIIY